MVWSICDGNPRFYQSNFKFPSFLEGPCGLREPFLILWTHYQPLVDSMGEISSFCGFRVKCFQPRHVPFWIQVVILLPEYTAKAET
ncbi:unnamed protein product [Spirodela intermedia]|uniref:Uncharacterized protein n=1 Tax=Spirodela intermedia TaxID=51605 RepID=A0A7I8LLS2_SPIIN|nr:unnamed protein product [Spirodela intermedia]